MMYRQHSSAGWQQHRVLQDLTAMSDVTDRPVIWSQFMSQGRDQIILCLIITTAIGIILIGYAEYFRELRIAAEIKALGGVAKIDNTAPAGLPEFWPCDRIESACLVMVNVPPKTVSDLGSLRSLQFLSLTATNVTDADLEQLSRLVGLEVLYLNDTRTTAQGRDKLRKALPNCRVYPQP